MGFIFRFEELSQAVKSRHQDVRVWAANRLAELYPKESAEVMLELLQKPDTFHAALHYFVEHPSEDAAEPLLEVCRTSDAFHSEKAMSALLDMGIHDFVPIVMKRIQDRTLDFLHPGSAIARRLAQTGAQEAIDILGQVIREVHEAYQKPADHGFLPEYLSTVVSALLSVRSPQHNAFLVHNFLESHGTEAAVILGEFLKLAQQSPFQNTRILRFRRNLDSIRRRELRRIRRYDPDTSSLLRRLLNEKKYLEVIQVAHRQSQVLFGTKYDATERDVWREWESLRPPVIPAFVLLESIRKADITQAGETHLRGLVTVSLSLYRFCLQWQKFIGLVPAKMPASDALKFLLENRPIPKSIEDALLRVVIENSSDSLISACLDALISPESRAYRRALDILCELQAKEALPELTNVLSGSFGDIPDPLPRLFQKMGELSIPVLQDFVERLDEIKVPALLDIFKVLPYPGTVQLLLSKFDEFYVEDKNCLLEAIEKTGSREFIPVVKEYMKPDEPDEVLYLLLCHIHGVEDPKLPAIEESIHKRKQIEMEREERFAKGDISAWTGNRIRLALKCNRCVGEYSYSLQNVLVHGDNVSIRDEVRCKNCGILNDYELSGAGDTQLEDHIVKQRSLIEDGLISANDGPVKLKPVEVSNRLLSPEEGIQHHESEITARPSRPGLRVQYGEFLLSLNRKAEARAQFEKGAELDSLAVEAIYALATLDLEAGKSRTR